MYRSLRKGSSSIYLQHMHTGHSIGAEQFEVQFSQGKVVLRFTLRPVNGNQRSDEEYLHTRPLRSVDLDDSYVIDRLRSYLSKQRSAIESWEVQIISRGKVLSFPVEISHRSQNAYEVIRFTVTSSDA